MPPNEVGVSQNAPDSDRVALMIAKFRQSSYVSNGRIAKDRVSKLFSDALCEDEVRTLLQYLPEADDGTLDFNQLIEFVFSTPCQAAGGGAVAARALRGDPPRSGGAGKRGGGTPKMDRPELLTGVTIAVPEPLTLDRTTTISPTAAQLAADVGKGGTPAGGDFLTCNTIASIEGKQSEWAMPVQLDRSLLREFLELDQRGKVQAEYVWLDSEYSDGHNFDLCSKSMTLDFAPQSVNDLPGWSYSGEEDGFAVEVVILPRRIYKDPFRRGPNIIVWTECFKSPRQGSKEEHGPPQAWNTRAACDAVMSRAISQGEEPWFGIEQEYYLLDVHTNWPLGWPSGDFPGPQGAYFCSTGAQKAPGRDVVESHYRACLYAGVKIGGINSEVAPGQWEFQVGPSVGIAVSDDLWMARYLLQRICELFQVNVTFDPKPVPDWAGLGCHTNYSTNSTRGPGGFDVIMRHCKRLEGRHKEHMEVYGDANERRLVGNDETQSIDRFSYGVGDRGASIRIPVKAASCGCGYYEDRRPAANMDPYQVTRMIVETTLLHDDGVKPMPTESQGQKGQAADAAAGSVS